LIEEPRRPQRNCNQVQRSKQLLKEIKKEARLRAQHRSLPWSQELLTPFLAKTFGALINGIADSVAVVATLPAIIWKSLALSTWNERTGFGAAMLFV